MKLQISDIHHYIFGFLKGKSRRRIKLEILREHETKSLGELKVYLEALGVDFGPASVERLRTLLQSHPDLFYLPKDNKTELNSKLESIERLLHL